MLSLLYFLLVLTIVVFVHELGHLIIAKKCGVKVLEFSIGFGKKICGFTDKSGVAWNIRCLPLGGYVKMYGDDNPSGSIGYSKKPTKDELKYALIYKHPLKKIAVAFAGPAMNFVLAIVLYIALFSTEGIPQVEPIIGDIMKNSQAEVIGLQKDDKIISVNGKKVASFNEIRPIIMKINENKITFELVRNNKQFTLTGIFKQGEPLGVMSNVVNYQKTNFIGAVKASFENLWMICSGTSQAVWNIIVHQKGLKGIGGPIAIAKQSAKAGQNGILALFEFIALISVSLGIINLLPILPLDGGHIAISFVELIIRRHAPNIAFKIFTYAGLVVVAFLMLLGFFNDLFINR